MIKAARKLLIALSTTILSGCSIVGYNHDTESAKYTVLKKDKSIEVRSYPELIVVKTTEPITENLFTDQGKAFKRLFDYISGDNTANAKISMTTPVLLDESNRGKQIKMTSPVFLDASSDQKSMSMSFVLPSEYTLETAPIPKNPDIQVIALPAKTVGVITFNGLLREENVKKNEDILEKWIDSKGYQKTGPATYAGYNPPWTIPFFRRNEVIIPLTMKK